MKSQVKIIHERSENKMSYGSCSARLFVTPYMFHHKRHINNEVELNYPLNTLIWICNKLQ